MFGICRYAATSVAGVFHGREFFLANLLWRGTAKFAGDFLTGWVAEVGGIICGRATVLT